MRYRVFSLSLLAVKRVIITRDNVGIVACIAGLLSPIAKYGKAIYGHLWAL